MIGKLLKFI